MVQNGDTGDIGDTSDTMVSTGHWSADIILYQAGQNNLITMF